MTLLNTALRSRLSRLPGLLTVTLGVACAGLTITSAADAAQFVRRSGDTPLSFTVPVTGTTMIAIPGDPIRSAVYDKAVMDVQTESASGQVYVLPRTEGDAMIYLTSESGETVALALTFADDAKPQSIILEKRPDTAAQPQADAVALRPLRAEGFSAEIKRFVTLILRHDTSGEIEKTHYTSPGPAAKEALRGLQPLAIRFDGVWRANDVEAYCATVKNGTISPVVLDPEALTAGSLYAAALTRTTLMPGESTVLILLEAPRAH